MFITMNLIIYREYKYKLASDIIYTDENTDRLYITYNYRIMMYVATYNRSIEV